jgi:Pyridoxamine 5'-phosphate oxidase
VSVRRWDLRPWRLPCAPIDNRIMTQRELEDLPPDECFRLLGAAHVGRLVYQDDLGPLAVPVNYAMAGHEIVFRVEGGAKRAAMQQPMLAFEVDQSTRTGSSDGASWCEASAPKSTWNGFLRCCERWMATARRRGQPASTKCGFRLCRTPSPGGGSVRRSCRGDRNAGKTGMKEARLFRRSVGGRAVGQVFDAELAEDDL